MTQPTETGVIVGIPYHRCGPFVARAVESVLAQTHQDLTVVVVNDGDPRPPWGRLAHLDDPRLVRFDLPVNRGRYFADAVVLEATRSPYYLVQDADDWSEPTRVETLLRALRTGHASGAVSAHRYHRAGSAPAARTTVQQWPLLTTPLGAQLRHRANFHGLFRCDALRAVGGFYGGFRIGYDTLLMSLLQMAGPVCSVRLPLYNLLLRSGSLTASRASGHGSHLRSNVRAQLDELYRNAYGCYCAYLAGSLGAESLTGRLRELARQHLSDDEAAALRDEARRLAALLGHVPSTAPVRPAQERKPHLVRPRIAVSPAPTDVDRLLGDRRIRWSEWTLSRATAVELAARLDRLRPRRVLELGSGVSTAVLASYADRRGATVLSLEHDPLYHQRTRRLLDDLGPGAHVLLRHAPLRPLACPDGEEHAWYDTDLEGDYDFVFVDGPPLRYGRTAALFAIAGHLAPGWEVWVDDGKRQHERDCVRRWHGHLRFASVLREVDDRGLWILRGEDRQTAQRPVPRDLAVTILTGGRPDLLERTVGTLVQSVPELLSNSHVVVMVNGSDEQTESYVRALPFVDRLLHHTGPRLSIGASTSRLMSEVVGRYVLHLEDDWATATLDDAWLQRSVAILDGHPHIGQVRLRHRSEEVLGNHMVTGAPIRWEQDDGFLSARSAHFTFNPSLLRVADVPHVFPCRNEAEAQRRFLRTRMGSAQLSPGVFRHLGARRSLRSPATV